MSFYPKISEIINLTVVEQSRFADPICVNNVNNPIILKAVDEKPNFIVWNATSIGNIAYIAVHCNGNYYRQKAYDLLREFKAYYLKQNN